jgi:hypothetical protein
VVLKVGRLEKFKVGWLERLCKKNKYGCANGTPRCQLPGARCGTHEILESLIFRIELELLAQNYAWSKER